MRTNKWFLFLCIGLCLLSFLSVTVDAKEIKGSIAIQTHEEDMKDEMFHLIKVASYENGQYVYTQAFQSLEEYDEQLSSNEKNKLAKIMHTMILEKKIDYDESQMMSSSGRMVFYDLDVGLYLICKEKSESYKMDPFLIHLPLQVNDELLYHIQVEPKFEKEMNQSEGVLPSPETSDKGHVCFYIFMMILSFIFLLTVSNRKGFNG